jgi:hypothetical protein
VQFALECRLEFEGTRRAFRSVPSGLTAIRLVAQQWFPEQRWQQVVEEEKELRTEADTIPARSI